MKRSFVVHPIKLTVSLFTSAVTLILSISAMTTKNIVAAVIFMAIALVFLGTCLVFGSVLTIDRDGVRRSFLGLTLRTLSWQEVAEIGVAGTKVLKKADSDRTGELYIYFSPVPLDDQARFEMMLKWPPQEQIFMYYTAARARAVMECTEKGIETYNAGKLIPGQKRGKN